MIIMAFAVAGLTVSINVNRQIGPMATTINAKTAYAT
jgi:hypothetical protein